VSANWRSVVSEIRIYALAVLCVVGVVTGTVVLRMAYRVPVTSTNQVVNSAIAGEAGIDIYGKMFVTHPPPAESAALLVLLHGARVDKELPYWEQVARLLDPDHVRIIAYCDSMACADRALGVASPGPLTISAYTEVISFYTIAGHVRISECVVRNEEWLFPKYIPCTPTKGVPEILAHRIKQSL
jgi:hypothetical protein